MAVDDPDEDQSPISEDEEMLSSATPSVPDMASDQTLAQPIEMTNSCLTSDGSARSAAKSAPEDDTVVDSTQDADANQKESRAKPKADRLNLNTGMKKEINLPDIASTLRHSSGGSAMGSAEGNSESHTEPVHPQTSFSHRA
jgi:hypothetical protein